MVNITSRRIRQVKGKISIFAAQRQTLELMKDGKVISFTSHQELFGLLHKYANENPEIKNVGINPNRFILEPEKIPKEEFVRILRLAKLYNHQLYVIKHDNGRTLYVLDFS
ncbi:MAG: hypothetical protein QXZ13_03130 [Candidatus Diapherotrites archaeon]